MSAHFTSLLQHEEVGVLTTMTSHSAAEPHRTLLAVWSALKHHTIVQTALHRRAHNDSDRNMLAQSRPAVSLRFLQLAIDSNQSKTLQPTTAGNPLLQLPFRSASCKPHLP